LVEILILDDREWHPEFPESPSVISLMNVNRKASSCNLRFVLVDAVTTQDHTLLDSVRTSLRDAEDAFLCVAFADRKGIHLLREELEQRQRFSRATRLLVTTTLGSTDTGALAIARDLGLHVRVLNPGGRTFHPKVYLGVSGASLQAIIGSANLTGGLATNIEAAMWLRGKKADGPLAGISSWAESLWTDPRTEEWEVRAAAEDAREIFAPELWTFLEREVRREPVFVTLGPQRKPNKVTDLTPEALYVETERSRSRGQREEIPAWMFNLAWEYLKTHRELSNRILLDELRVHRSSAVCAILARHPAVRVRPKIVLRLRDA
jgi:HKD family nuclease